MPSSCIAVLLLQAAVPELVSHRDDQGTGGGNPLVVAMQPLCGGFVVTTQPIHVTPDPPLSP